MADTPFGLSFGNPSKYMGQSPLADVGRAAKTALTAYGLQKLGVTDFLNNLSKKPEQQTVVQGAVPLPASFNQFLAPAIPPKSNSSQAQMGTVPFVADTNLPAMQAPQMTPITPPPDIGNRILEGDDSWQHSGLNMPNQMFG